MCDLDNGIHKMSHPSYDTIYQVTYNVQSHICYANCNVLSGHLIQLSMSNRALPAPIYPYYISSMDCDENAYITHA